MAIEHNSSYGIFSTTGKLLHGSFPTTAELNPAAMSETFDACKVSLYLSCQQMGTVVLGAAVEVREIKENNFKGREDRVIYLERVNDTRKLSESGLMPFYDRMHAALNQHGYAVLGLPVSPRLFETPEAKSVSPWDTREVVSYTLGKLYVGKSVVCVSNNVMKSLYYVDEVLKKISLVGSKKMKLIIAASPIPDADILILSNPSYGMAVDFEINHNEIIKHNKYGKYYVLFSSFGGRPIREIISKTENRLPAGERINFRKFLQTEKIGESRPANTQAQTVSEDLYLSQGSGKKPAAGKKTFFDRISGSKLILPLMFLIIILVLVLVIALMMPDLFQSIQGIFPDLFNNTTSDSEINTSVVSATETLTEQDPLNVSGNESVFRENESLPVNETGTQAPLNASGTGSSE